ncbi:MAG: COQ9 family protein [Alphaproteobacteria bacterium]
MNNQNLTQIRDDILTAALPDIAFDGWNWDTIERAAEQSDHNANTAFPNKVIDALDHFADLADREMLNALEETPAETLRIRDRVQTALMARYTFLFEHQEAFRASLKFWLNPIRKPRAAKITWRTADAIWDWAGDTATDYNRYTKRGLLSGIIASSALVFVNDCDDSLPKTHDFIEKHIENVMKIGKFTAKFKRKA